MGEINCNIVTCVCLLYKFLFMSTPAALQYFSIIVNVKLPILQDKRMHMNRGWNVAQVLEHCAVKVWILLLADRSCMVHAFAIWAIFHSNQWSTTDWSIKGSGMCCPTCGKVSIKDLLLLIEKSNLCGNSGFPLKEICHNDHMFVVLYQ